MSDKELRSMDRLQLLNIMRRQEAEIEKLNEELKRSAEYRRASFENDAGSPAEMSAEVSGMIKATQEAADAYLEKIKLMEANAKKIEDEAREKAAAIIRDAARAAEEIKKGELWAEYMEFINDVHKYLHEILDKYSMSALSNLVEPTHIKGGG